MSTTLKIVLALLKERAESRLSLSLSAEGTVALQAHVAALAAAPAVPLAVVGAASDGASLIAAERLEQVTKHGWDLRRDADYVNKELVQAAVACIGLYYGAAPGSAWPWQSEFGMSYFHKIRAKSDVDKLKVAGALLAAEIDRLQGTQPPAALAAPVAGGPGGEARLMVSAADVAYELQHLKTLQHDDDEHFIAAASRLGIDLAGDTPALSAPPATQEAGGPADSRLLSVLKDAEDALSRCYDVTEWPANGDTAQDAALSGIRAILPALSSPATQEAGGGVGAEYPAPAGKDARGRWVWQDYKPTEEELWQAFKQSLYQGCEVYCPQWSSKQPHLFFTEVDEGGVTMWCAAWADKTPERYTWDALRSFLRTAGIASYTLPVPTKI